MTDIMREAFERDMNAPSSWEELLSWNEAFDDYCKGYQAAQADARALVGELVDVLYDLEGDTLPLKRRDAALTKAQAFMEQT